VQIIGVSFDTPAENQAWALDEGFEFDLWSDADRVLAMHYGAASSPTQGSASRVTRLLDEDGYVVLEYAVSSVGTHPFQVLEDVEALWGGTTN
jgi:peroxiredoxin Q/BCP